MATAFDPDFRLRAGTYNSADMTSGYAIVSWAVQTDQGLGNPDWSNPNFLASSAWLTAEEQSVTTDLGLKDDGFIVSMLVFDVWTTGMLDYFYDTYLASGVNYAAVTYKLVDVDGTAKYINATLHRPTLGRGLTKIEGGYRVELRLLGGEETAT